MSLTCASSPAAIAVYDDTQPSTSNRGAPYRSRDAYASSTVSGWYVISRPVADDSSAATSASVSASGPVTS